jgi:hypothetical protein
MSAQADTINWTNWTSQTAGASSGSAVGTISFSGGPVTVSYSGNVSSNASGYWLPAAIFKSPGSPGLGLVDNAPLDNNNIPLTGGTNTSTNTISFSTAVVNPVMALLSLGGNPGSAEFDFQSTPSQPINISTVFTGPGTTQYTENGVLSWNEAAMTVSGLGASGIVQFQGTYNSISWTNPVYETWFMFTVGAPSAVPLPATLMLFGPGLVGLAAIRRRFKK